MYGQNKILGFILVCIFTIFPKAQEITTIPEVVVGNKKKVFLYTLPHITPSFEEIKTPTEEYFFDTVSDKISRYNQWKFIRVKNTLDEKDENFSEQISDLCQNNNADYTVIPIIKFFKVGFGKYIFSSQVSVSLLVYNPEGNLVFTSTYDTFKRKGRMFGSAENSIKKGTEGAINTLYKTMIKEKNLNKKNIQ